MPSWQSLEVPSRGSLGTHFENCCGSGWEEVWGSSRGWWRPLNCRLRLHPGWTNRLMPISELWQQKEEVSSGPLLSILRCGVCQSRGPCWTFWKALGPPWTCWPGVGPWWHLLPSSPRLLKSGISLMFRSRGPAPRFWIAPASLQCHTMEATFTSPRLGTRTKSPFGTQRKVGKIEAWSFLWGRARAPVLVGLSC